MALVRPRSPLHRLFGRAASWLIPSQSVLLKCYLGRLHTAFRVLFLAVLCDYNVIVYTLIMIVMENLIEQSVLLNAISGCAMFVAGLYLVRYYYAEQLARLHGVYSDESPLKRSLVHAGLAAVPYAILLLIFRNFSLHDKLQCSAHFPFLHVASGLVPLSILAREHFAKDYHHLSCLAGYAICASGAAVVATLNRYLAAAAVALQALVSLVLLQRLKGSAPARIPELSYALGPFLRGILQAVRSVLYPLELVLDYSLIIQATKDKAWVPSLPIRAFISPYLNASLFIIYHNFTLPLGAMLTLSAVTFCAAILLFLCARKEAHAHYIYYYSFAVMCAYLYAITDEQLRITGFISRKMGCQLTTAAIWYAMPHVCLHTLVLNAYIHSTGQKQASLFAAFLTHVFYTLVLFCTGVAYGLAFPSYSILQNRVFLIGTVLSSLLCATSLYYLTVYSRYFTDLALVSLFYVVVYIYTLIY